MEKKTISENITVSIDLPYSPAVAYGNIVYISGQVPMNPETNSIVAADFSDQAEQVFSNLEYTLTQSGSSLEKVIKTTAFLTNLDDFPALNEIYKKRFPNERPARSCVEVSRLPFDAKVEIEAIAYI
jgi:2-iminobutanoate/2-iminopropanoate deaminase